jgi:hypothetical protein
MVFLPMVALMFLINYLRFFMTKILNSKSTPMLQPASLSFRTLRGTMLQHKADPNRDRADQDEVDLNACLAKIKDDVKYGNAVLRSAKIRKHCSFLPENSIKQRKAYFCAPESGFF